jgi:hypothetical protein
MSWFSALTCKALKALGADDPHSWSKLQHKDRCIHVQTCLRCGEEREVAIHEFGEWRYKEPDSCAQVRTCEKCGKEETRVSHGRTKEEFKGPKSCVLVTRCQRCGVIMDEDPIPAHSFVDGRCRRCGEQGHVITSGVDDDNDDDDPNPDLGHRGPLTGWGSYG